MGRARGGDGHESGEPSPGQRRGQQDEHGQRRHMAPNPGERPKPRPGRLSARRAQEPRSAASEGVDGALGLGTVSRGGEAAGSLCHHPHKTRGKADQGVCWSRGIGARYLVWGPMWGPCMGSLLSGPCRVLVWGPIWDPL